MRGCSSDVLARMPLAEAVLLVYRWVADESHLAGLYEQHRGRCREQIISFSLLVQLIADALVKYGGSGRQSFEHAAEARDLRASVQATYGKLRRVPVEVSMAFLAECTSRLMELFPDAAAAENPASLSQFHVVVLDGKAIKKVAKRLKPLRGVSGGVLGGRALVALSLKTDLAVAMHAHPDGDANDIRFLPDLLPVVRERIPAPRLWLADRAFCGPQLFAKLVEKEDHFLVRYSRRTPFTPDPNRPSQRGQDATGRTFVERWGWLGRRAHPQRCYVRRITLQRAGQEAVIVVTDLLDEDRYAATDLLDLYLSRWGIERMFQQVTEVFGLKALIGCSPKATIFQFAFCLLLYNVIQVVRAYVAAAQGRQAETISAEKLFVDVQQELIAWKVLLPVRATVTYLTPFSSAPRIRRRLHRLLDARWTPRWIKAPTRKRRATTKRSAGTRCHKSAFRLIKAHDQMQLAKRQKGR